jgi:myo-inositol-1(or 4)-monophosphatase
VRVVDDVQLAISAATAGAEVVRSWYGRETSRFDKGLGDFATEADLASEEAVHAAIRTARPDDAFRGEETGHTGPEDAARVWLVDPLCGTLNFAAGTSMFAVNVALRADGQVTAAASAEPVTGDLFWTDGVRAHRRTPDGTDHPLVPDPRCHLVDIDLWAQGRDPSTLTGYRLLGNRDFHLGFDPRMSSTSLALVWLAAGRRGGYVVDGDVHDSVHYAAPLALCRAVGCTLTALDGGPLERPGAGLVAAADADVHRRLLTLLG